MNVISNAIFTIAEVTGKLDQKPAEEQRVREVVSSLTKLVPDVVAMCVYRIGCHFLLREMKKQSFYAKAIVSTVCVTQSDFLDEMGIAGQFIMATCRRARAGGRFACRAAQGRGRSYRTKDGGPVAEMPRDGVVRRGRQGAMQPTPGEAREAQSVPTWRLVLGKHLNTNTSCPNGLL